MAVVGEVVAAVVFVALLAIISKILTKRRPSYSGYIGCLSIALSTMSMSGQFVHGE